MRFLRNISKEPLNARAKRRLMERELKKLNDGQRTSDKLDDGQSSSDGTKWERTAFGFIMTDIDEFGFEDWLELPHDYVVESFLNTTYEVSNSLMSDLRTILKQEKDELEELGIEQTMRVDLAGLVGHSTLGYWMYSEPFNFISRTQTQANALYNAHQD